VYYYVKIVTDHVCHAFKPNPVVYDVPFFEESHDEIVEQLIKHGALNFDGAWGVTIEHFICEV